MDLYTKEREISGVSVHADLAAGAREGDLDGGGGAARDDRGLGAHHVIVGLGLLTPFRQPLVQRVAAAEGEVTCNKHGKETLED